MNKALDRILVTEETADKIKTWARENKYLRSDGYLYPRTMKRFSQKELPMLEALYEWTSSTSKKADIIGIEIGKKISQIIHFNIISDEVIRCSTSIKVEGRQFDNKEILKFDFNIFDEEFINYEDNYENLHDESFKNGMQNFVAAIIVTLVFMAEFREVKEVISESRVAHINPNRKKDKNRNRKVVKIGVYHINPNFQVALEKRKFERHAEAWGVRGHWRTYKKSGKRVWVAEHKKGQGEKEGKTYTV